MRLRFRKAGALTLADVCIVIAMAVLVLVYLVPRGTCRAREQANSLDWSRFARD